MKRVTYTINLEDAKREYENNSIFQEIIQTGCFIYINRSFVPNTPEYVCREYGIPKLTDHAAKLPLHEFALAFDEVITYVQGDETRSDDRGSGGRKTVRKSTINFNTTNQKNELSQDIIRQHQAYIDRFENQRPLKKTCWQRINEIIGDDTAYSFEQKTHLSSDYFYKATSEVDDCPKLETIVAIAAGYNLDLSLTEELLKLAGHAFIPTSRRHNTYIFILTAMCEYDMDAKNKLLTDTDKTFKPLGTITNENPRKSKPKKKEQDSE